LINDFPKNQYVSDEATEKVGVVLHHSAGSDNARLMYEWWKNDTQGRVATAFAIEDDGTVYQGFPVQNWGFAIYVNAKTNRVHTDFKTGVHQVFLEKRYVQLEICNYGYLTKKGNKFYAYTNREIPKEKVYEYDSPFRGKRYWERYTVQEIEAIGELLVWLNQEHGISVRYNPDMFDWENTYSTSLNALKGGEGVWSHTSFRTDKMDIHPQPDLIEKLKQVHNQIYKDKVNKLWLDQMQA